jgi:Tol biopolymer transport system component
MNSNPSFSPNGKFIVFESNRDGNSEIYLMIADGKNQTRLTNNTFMDSEPMFMLDGHSIVFVGHRSTDDDLGVYVMDLLKKE